MIPPPHIWSESVSELVYLTSLLDSQGLMIDGHWYEGRKGPRHEYTGFRTREPVFWSRVFYRSTERTPIFGRYQVRDERSWQVTDNHYCCIAMGQYKFDTIKTCFLFASLYFCCTYIPRIGILPVPGVHCYNVTQCTALQHCPIRHSSHSRALLSR